MSENQEHENQREDDQANMTVPTTGSEEGDVLEEEPEPQEPPD